ncbi:MAG: NADH-quinone oxidoreductase subunit NuoK [Phycisphaerae bacterium]|nr:NADH-quinone oxidoreductase subunit NuoK [Phycisphaerae bacterium]
MNILSVVSGHHGLAVAAALFAVGLLGVLTRRNLLFVLLSLEIMLNAAGLAFVAAGALWGQADGQIMFLFILATAAAETAIGLTLLLIVFREKRNLNSDAIADVPHVSSRGVKSNHPFEGDKPVANSQ